MTALLERLSIGGLEFPYLPAGANVKVTPQRESETVVTLSGKRVKLRGALNGHRIEVDSGQSAVPGALRTALLALYRAGTPFTLIETYSEPTETHVWPGCTFADDSPPEFSEIGGSERDLFTFKFIIDAGV